MNFYWIDLAVILLKILGSGSPGLLAKLLSPEYRPQKAPDKHTSTQIQTDEKEAELVSSKSVVEDEFALYSTDLELAGDYLAVSARGRTGFPFIERLTVFSFDGSSWIDRYVKEFEDGRRYEINGEELIMETAHNEVALFDISDGSILQAITPSCPNADTSSDAVILILTQ